ITAEWCIAAPGSDIYSTVLSEGVDPNNNADSLPGDWVVDSDGNLRFELEDRTGYEAYPYRSGTSMAAPHVTGALGLLLERFPYLTAAQVRDVMLTTATDLGAPGVDEVYGWGLLDVAGGEAVVNGTISGAAANVRVGAGMLRINGSGRL